MKLNDVTLREGDQMPGREYTAEEKLACARRLDDLGVAFIQPGFPVTGEKDRRVISELAGTTDASVVALARALDGDVDAALEANADVVEVFVTASASQREHLLGASMDEMCSMLGGAVDRVRDGGATPHVTLADAFRTPRAELVEILEHVPRVPMVTLADSVGAVTPPTVEAFLAGLASDVDFSRLGVHFHDDLGCGTANALVAYDSGIGKADVSVAAIGERAGNTALEELVAACVVDFEDDLGLAVDELVPTCRAILSELGEEYDGRKAILGEKTTEHESGIHVAAMLQEPSTLEPFDPATFGGQRRLLFGAQTGASATRQLLERAGIDPDEEVIETLQDRLTERGPLELDDALELARAVAETAGGENSS